MSTESNVDMLVKTWRCSNLRHWLRFLIPSILVLVIGAGCSLTNLEDGLHDKGSLIVDSPEIASVYVDGAKVGETNSPIDGMTEGKHAITVKLEDGTVLLSQTIDLSGTGLLRLSTEVGAEPTTPSDVDKLADIAEESFDEAPEATEVEDISTSTEDGTAKTLYPITVRTEAIANGTKYETTLYIIESKVKGPTIWVVGGVHGNESAGYISAGKLTEYSIKKGRMIVLPKANILACKAHDRYTSATGDLNRDFPKSASYKADSYLARAIQDAIRKYKPSYFIDLHEGFDYYKNKSTSSVGQTIIYYPEDDARTIASKIANNLNSRISSSYKEFAILKYPVSGSLARYAGEAYDIPSMIFETAQKVSLDTRIDYHMTAVLTYLKHLGMR